MEQSNYLFRLAKTFSTTNEQLSRFYMLKFIQTIKSNEIGFNAELLPQFCSYCYTVFVPGINCTIEMIPKSKKNTDGEKKTIINHVPQLITELKIKNADKLLYNCSKCNTTHVFPIAKPVKNLLINKESKNSKQKQKDITKNNSSAHMNSTTASTTTPHKSSDSSAKDFSSKQDNTKQDKKKKKDNNKVQKQNKTQKQNSVKDFLSKLKV